MRIFRRFSLPPPPPPQTGSEGLEHFDPSKGPESVPDLVLLDCMLPDMTGLDVCRLIRQRFSKHALPIIMVSARTHDTAIAEGLQAGANDYVVKPFRRGEMMARIRAHLRARAVGQIQNARASSSFRRAPPAQRAPSASLFRPRTIFKAKL